MPGYTEASDICTYCRVDPVERYGDRGFHGTRCTTCVDIAIADGHTCPTCHTAPTERTHAMTGR